MQHENEWICIHMCRELRTVPPAEHHSLGVIAENKAQDWPAPIIVVFNNLSMQRINKVITKEINFDSSSNNTTRMLSIIRVQTCPNRGFNFIFPPSQDS